MNKSDFHHITGRFAQGLNPSNNLCHLMALNLQLILFLTVASTAQLARSADGSQPPVTAPASSSASMRVGGLGRPEALVFEGNKTFSSDQIRVALRSRMEFHLAAHPAAPLADYPATVEKMVRVAYLRQGFPYVRVQASVEAAQARVRVRIDEGARFETGQIQFAGVKAIRQPALQKRLRAALAGGEEANNRDRTKSLWGKEKYAPFDETATKEIKDRLLGELAEQNYYKPKLKVTVVPVPNVRRGDLLIELVDEGLKGTIDDIGFFYPADEKKNSDAEVAEYLELKAGMPLRANLTTELTNRLWRTGRFLKQEARIVPLPGEGHFRLEIDLEDLDEAQPLRQTLSTHETTVLKLCEWLNEFPRCPEDLVLAVRENNGAQNVFNAEVVLSKSGLAWLLRNEETNRPLRLAYAMVLSNNRVSSYSGWRRHKLITPAAGSLTAFISVLPNGNPKALQRYDLTLGAGVSSEESEQPIDISLRLAPVTFLEWARKDKAQFTSHKGELEAAFPTGDNSEMVRVRVDQNTGRLIYGRFDMRTNDLHLTLEARSERGGYQRLLSEITTATAQFPNDYAADYPKSSWLGFVLADVLESSVLESFAASNFVAAASSPQRAQAWVAESRQIREALSQLRRTLGKPNLAECLRPFEHKLDRLFPRESKPAQDFYVPLQPVLGQNSLAVLLGLAAAWLIDKSDLMWPPNSWPWTLARETGFTLANQNPYTGAELERLFASEQTGPLGSWAAAALLTRFNAPLAEKFARRSLTHLQLHQLEMDLGVLFAPENVGGQLLAETLKQLGQLHDSDFDALSGVLGADLAHLVKAAALAAQGQTNQPPVEVLRPTLAEAWNTLLRPQIETSVKGMLRRVGTPDSPEAAFERASFILQTASKPEEFSEAARVLEIAANQGLARAQLWLGWLHQNGKGVPLDYHEALNWFMKAADQREPHAACAIGDMYFAGQGTPADKAVAMIWYEREARRGCARAQFQLGQCAEEQSNPAQAFAWYRLAATNGFAEAQTALAERLSDELRPTPDYFEAYLWYRVAAEAGNRVAAVSARRVKGKLTSDQVEQAEKEACKLAKRISQRASEQ